MHKHEIRTEGDALVYLADCTLATVETLAMRKSPPKAELERQVMMASDAIRWIDQFGLNSTGTRVADVKAAGGMEPWLKSLKG